MSARATDLADQTADAINQTIAFVEAVPMTMDGFLRAGAVHGGRVGYPHHEFPQPSVVNLLVKPVSQGEPLFPITPEQIHAGNAENARKNANRAKADVVADLRRNGAEARPPLCVASAMRVAAVSGALLPA